MYGVNGPYSLNGPADSPTASAIRGGFSDVPGVPAVNANAGPTVVRGALVGGSSGSVAAAATGTITITPQSAFGFRIEDISFPDNLAVDITINSITIGTRNFIASSTGVPGACMAASANRYPLNMDTLPPGQSCTIGFTNNAGVARTVTVLAAGSSLQ